jgi:hypothetical protein
MYWFKFSVDARQKDVIEVDITSLENVKIYTARGDDKFTAEGGIEFDPKDFRAGSVPTSLKLTSTYPDGLFVTMASTDRVKNSQFELTYEVIAGENVNDIAQSGDAGLFELTADGQLSSRTIIFIVVTAVVGVLVLIMSIICCYVCK